MAAAQRSEKALTAKPQTRASNIELLRILTMLGVIVLHYNNAGIGGGFALVEKNSLNFYIMHIFESISIVAVDLFVLISGFFMCRSTKRDIFKPLSLIFQVIVFKELIYILSVLLSGKSISLKAVLLDLVPNNYFVILYIAVYLVSPFINLLLEALDGRNRKRLVILLMIVFSLEPTVVDMLNEIRGETFHGLSTVGAYGSQWGYSAVNFILMYIIGAYLRYNEDKIKSFPKWKAGLGFIAFVAADTVWSLVNEHFTIYDARSAYEYCNPLVIGGTVLIFVLFHNMQIRSSRIINLLAKASFTVYLTHAAMLKYFRIAGHVNRNAAVYVLHVLATAAAIYLVSWVMFICYDLVTRPLFGFVRSKIHFYEYDVKPEEKNNKRNKK
ncbi:MAG: acyltransferase [Ruminococcus sp.]|nr:acyltransferase [Ruminococcus sp.]